MNALTSIPALATLFGLGFFSGLNLYAVVLVSGLGIRYRWIDLMPELRSLEILAHPAIIVASSVMYVIEFFADKVPWVDNIWDIVHTVIRPLAATFLALHVLGNQSPEVRILAALICGTLALTSHAAKAGTRVSANMVSPFEPFTNIGLSLAEDAIAIGALYFVWKHPYVTLAIITLFLIAILWFAPVLIRGFLSLFKRKQAPVTS